MKKRRKILLILCSFLLAFAIFNPNAFAESKEGLAHVVQEHAKKIAQLEKAIKELNGSGSDSQKEALSDEVKKALLKEAGREIAAQVKFKSYGDNKFNVTDYQIHEIDGEPVLQIFTEGSYDWTTETSYGEEEGDYIEEGAGRSFARGLLFSLDHIVKMYGVNLKYEFYENGERITVFTEIN